MSPHGEEQAQHSMLMGRGGGGQLELMKEVVCFFCCYYDINNDNYHQYFRSLLGMEWNHS